MKWKTPLPIVGIAILLAACAVPGESPEPSVSPTSTATRAPFSTFPVPSSSTTAAPSGVPETVWVAVLDDLVDRVDGGAVAPTVVTAEARTWTDGSLGCPQPGQAYTQALVDGYHVVVEVDGERYDYRIGSGTSVRLCEGNGLLEGDD